MLLDVDNGGDDGSQESMLDHQYAFVARLENVKIFSQLLKSIHFRFVEFNIHNPFYLPL